MGGGKGGGSSSTVEITNSGTTNVNSNSVVDIVGLDDIDMRTELVLPQPLRTENESRNELAITEPIAIQSDSNSRTELAITEPIVSDSTSRMALDVRPLVIDSCTRLEFGPIPPMHIHQPYHRHFGITLFGLEILGFNMSGEEQLIIQSLPDKPHVIGRPTARHADDDHDHKDTRRAKHSRRRPSAVRRRPSSGHRASSGRLRIHLDP